MSRETALVTGAGSGLGLELAIMLAGHDDRVVVGLSRRVPQDERWDELERSRRVLHIAGDASDPGTVEAAFASAERQGVLTLVANCAGSAVFGPVGEY